jgi:hypothetical protein
MADAPGSNGPKDLAPMLKETYSKAIVKAVPGVNTRARDRFRKLKSLLKPKIK